jgi:hypothetical protein
MNEYVGSLPRFASINPFSYVTHEKIVACRLYSMVLSNIASSIELIMSIPRNRNLVAQKSCRHKIIKKKNGK